MVRARAVRAAAQWLVGVRLVVAACAARCLRCARCSLVSFSAANDDCSWYFDCPAPRPEVAGYQTVRMRAAPLRVPTLWLAHGDSWPAGQVRFMYAPLRV